MTEAPIEWPAGRQTSWKFFDLAGDEVGRGTFEVEDFVVFEALDLLVDLVDFGVDGFVLFLFVDLGAESRNDEAEDIHNRVVLDRPRRQNLGLAPEFLEEKVKRPGVLPLRVTEQNQIHVLDQPENQLEPQSYPRCFSYSASERYWSMPQSKG